MKSMETSKRMSSRDANRAWEPALTMDLFLLTTFFVEQVGQDRRVPAAPH
jgi:hypothetical protein